jgi:hypothetical protein
MRRIQRLAFSQINASAIFYEGDGAIDAGTGMYVQGRGDQLFAAVPAMVSVVSRGEVLQAGADTETFDIQITCNTSDLTDTVSTDAVVSVTCPDLGLSGAQFELRGGPVRSGLGSGLSVFAAYQSQADDRTVLS